LSKTISELLAADAEPSPTFVLSDLDKVKHPTVPVAETVELPPELVMVPFDADPKLPIVTVARSVPVGADSAFAFTVPV